jgi:integrase
MALSAGEPLGWVAESMGHADAWMTLKVYAKWIPSAYPTAGQALVQILDKATFKQPDPSDTTESNT